AHASILPRTCLHSRDCFAPSVLAVTNQMRFIFFFRFSSLLSINNTMARRENTVRVEEDRVVNIEKRRKVKEESEENRFFTTVERREALGFVMLALSIVLFASLILNPNELMGIESSALPSPAGKFGRWIAKEIGILFGLGGLVMPLAFGAWGFSIFKGRQPRALFAKALALAVGLISVSAFLGLINRGGYLGGALGDRLSADLYQDFGLVSFLMVIFAGMISLVIGTPLSFSGVFSACIKGIVLVWKGALSLEEKIAERIYEKRENPDKWKEAKAERKVKKEPAQKTENDEADSTIREYFDKVQTRVVKTPALKLLSGGTEPEKKIEPDVNQTAFEDEKNNSAEIVDSTIYKPLDEFTLPDINLLEDPKPLTEAVTQEDLLKKAQDLQTTLSDFNVLCKIGDIVPGPTVTRFEVVPNPGVKVTSITALADDIALAMAAPSIRIEAPIPGKSAVGIEIPNRKAHKVTLKEIITSDEFKKMRKESPLTVALGSDIAGAPVITDLRRMPHLLIAGSTGSGKSVCINAIVNSILFSSLPTEVKMLMVDPKVVELQGYDDIPHLISPVCTDSRKAPQVLMWAVEEMDRRYRFLAQAGVRDIESYNKLSADLPKSESEDIDNFADIDEEVSNVAKRPNRLPYVLIVVDEFSDLMMVAPKECEEAIIRVAQMARAVGIHLIIATQRPSVDVITGVIKANLPSRISFKVSSKVDSQTILDQKGSERLLGAGDMLFRAAEFPKPVRLQGCYVSNEEINSVVKHYRDQGIAKKAMILKDNVSNNSDLNTLDENQPDPFLEKAMRICLRDGMASVSRLQRVLNVGHPRAARLVDTMEAMGLVTPPDGSKPRKLLFDETYFEKSESESQEEI
ncbi:TPA: hypothetical protein DEF17_02080, partial [bacterium]|nr:hypothetical protein [bacterium]